MGSHRVTIKLESQPLSDARRTCEDINVSSSTNVREYMSVDDMLVKHVGEFGYAQFCHFVLVSLAWTVEALHTMVMIFGDRVPEWRCLPQSGNRIHTLNDTGNSIAACAASSSFCQLEPAAWEWIGGKSRSTVSEWGLICGEEYKAGLSGSLFFIGSLLGAGIYGNLSDSVLGRRGSLALSCTTTVALGLLTSLAPSYWIYAFLRLLTGLNCGGIGLCSFVLATETVGPNKRGSVGMSAFYFFSSGVMLLSVFSYFSTSWRSLYIVTTIPGMVYCALVLPFTWESPRWYLVKGRVGHAMRVLRAFAKLNGSSVPDFAFVRLDNCTDGRQEDDRKGLTTAVRQEHFESELVPLVAALPDCQAQSTKLEDDQTEESVGTLLGVFRYGETRWRLLVMICIWFFTGVVYYGISLNVVNLGFNLYVGVFVNGLIEIPALAFTAILLGRLGRKAMLVGAMGVSGVCCLVGSVFFAEMAVDGSKSGTDILMRRMDSNNITSLRFEQANSSGLMNSSPGGLNGVLRLSSGVVGIFGMAATYNLIYIYTTELFPTVVRNAALGLATQAAGIGAIIAPFVVVVGHFYPSIPFLIFGLLAITGAAMASRLPETLNQALDETMEGMERTISEKRDHGSSLTTNETNLKSSSHEC